MSRLGKYIRKNKHKRYLEESIHYLSNMIHKGAILHGTVDVTKRKLFLKYVERLKKIDNAKEREKTV